jgi:hypothetical protein
MNFNQIYTLAKSNDYDIESFAFYTEKNTGKFAAVIKIFNQECYYHLNSEGFKKFCEDGLLYRDGTGKTFDGGWCEPYISFHYLKYKTDLSYADDKITEFNLVFKHSYEDACFYPLKLNCETEETNAF